MEESFGVFPLQWKKDQLYIFLVQNYGGAWLVPKGHADGSESPREAAARELQEETGLSVQSWIDCNPVVEHYTYIRDNKKIAKQVTYFFAFVIGDVSIQKTELYTGQWVLLENAHVCVSFPQMKDLIMKSVSLMREGRFSKG